MDQIKYKELEHLRSSLYEYVSGVPSQLSSATVLKISILLDNFIMEAQKEMQ